jgi:hypothetical protein
VSRALQRSGSSSTAAIRCIARRRISSCCTGQIHSDSIDEPLEEAQPTPISSSE